MAEFKVVIGSKSGKSKQIELKDKEADAINGKKIGDTIKGEDIGIAGYEFKITGGSDKAGFPMRWDVSGTAKKRILAVEGVGMKRKAKGIKQRKTVAGNTIFADIAQVNLQAVKEGKPSIFDEKKEEKKEEAPAEGEAKPEEGKEAPKEEKKEDKPAEAPKEDKPEKKEEVKEEAPKEEKKEAKEKKKEDKPEEKK